MFTLQPFGSRVLVIAASALLWAGAPFACSSSGSPQSHSAATGGVGYVIPGTTGGQANDSTGGTMGTGGTAATTTVLHCPDLASNPNDCPTKVSTEDYHIQSQFEIDALEGYTEIGDFVVEMSSVTDFAALHCLQKINGRFEIGDNDSLTSLDGLQNLREVTDWVDINSNPLMTMGCGLRKLSKIGANALTPYIDIAYNDSLERIEMTLIDSSAGHFRAHDNELLTVIIGSPNVTRVGQFWIGRNASLTSATGFTGLKTVSDFQVTQNPKLPFCQVQAMADGLDLTPATFVTSGNLGDTCP